MTEIKKIGILTGGGDCPGLNAVIRAIVKTAIEKYAKKVILCHNHPSNNILPSRQDYITFETLKTALNLVNVKLLDSLIIGEECFYSVLKEKIYNL